jgi:hypothetical protein
VTKTWLSFINLSDHYERKARFLPGVLSILPLLPVSAAYGGILGEWLKLLLTGVGLGAVVAVALSHIASAFGNRFQEKLWTDWPHDSPTNRWLHPEDRTISLQQKKLWYQATKELTGLDIESVVKQENPEETKAIINDAVKALRDRLWKAPEADRVRLHNIDYGFSRNLTGLRLIWILFAIGSALGCWAGYAWYEHPLVWSLASTIIAVLLIPIGYFVLPGYVRKKAHYYAESFFGALMILSNAEHHREV